MKKTNLTIVATIIATFVISIFAFQPTTEASNSATPSATPKRKRLPVAIQSPVTIQSPKPSSARTKRTNKSKGIMQDYYPHSNIRSKIKRKGYTAIPELDANSNERRKSPRKRKN